MVVASARTFQSTNLLALPFNRIEKHHLLQAIDILRSEGVPRGNASTTYAVRVDDDLFPPPLLVATAAGLAMGAPFNGEVRGGKNTKCFRLLDKHGFEIVRLDELGTAGRPISEEGFELELDLELTLMERWSETPFGAEYENPVRQHQSDTGPIDLLAEAKDKSHFLILELKRDKASDKALGQLQRYMGYVLSKLCTPTQHVRGVIVAQRPDKAVGHAMLVNPSIEMWLAEAEPFSLTRWQPQNKTI